MKSWTTQVKGAEFKVMRLQDAMPVMQTLDTPAQIVSYLRERIPTSARYNQDTENLILLCLNARLRPIGFEVISNGTLDSLMVHPREVFKPAIVLGAAKIVMAHNHPSGDPTPSAADIKVTRDLVRAGELLQIELMDHVVIGHPDFPGGKGYSSLRELGHFYR